MLKLGVCHPPPGSVGAQIHPWACADGLRHVGLGSGALWTVPLRWCVGHGKYLAQVTLKLAEFRFRIGRWFGGSGTPWPAGKILGGRRRIDIGRPGRAGSATGRKEGVMTIGITMPCLLDNMEEGTLIKWRVKVGDRVVSGDVLADIATGEATMSWRSLDEGTVARLALEENRSAPIGTLIIELAGDASEGTGTAAGSVAAPSIAEASPPGENVAAWHQSSGTPSRRRAWC